MNESLDVLRDMCREKLKSQAQWDWAKRYIERGDNIAVEVGIFTPEIARKLGIKNDQARYLLKKLAKESLVVELSHSGWTSRWWPVGLAEDLMSEKYKGTVRSISDFEQKSQA